ncbi:nuclear transport factor 2 family protein [Dyella sp. C9]|uniref:nuclear transport factor 2 family protein n=1 Tax=Dyella sp. C9 TaxID=2202154 RepID=UPI001E360432|nr:nuclear transport factor 2 family protein [Dyella sp. C9]
MRVLLCSLILTMVAACHRAPDESRIRQGIEAATRAAEQVDAGGLGDVLSDDFIGNGDAADRRQLMGLLRAAAFRGETLHALVGPVTVESRGDRYVASFTVTLASGGRLFPSQAGIYKVETAWRKDGGEWRCYSATWTSGG